MPNIKTIYKQRFCQKEIAKKILLWKSLCKFYLQSLIDKDDTVMDIGAGYCEFINAINCKHKIAVDPNPYTKINAQKNVKVLAINAENIPQSYYGKINIILMSNFLEHLLTKDHVLYILNKSYKLLAPQGKLIIIQPNIDLAKEKYWDRIDHHIALNEKGIVEALSVSGFKQIKAIRRFLPLTVQSKLPAHPILIRLYLVIPPKIRPFAAQSLIIATK